MKALFTFLTKNPAAAFVGLVAVLLALALAKSNWEVRSLREAHAEVTQKRDRLASEAAAHRARADGWEVEFADSTARLGRLLASRDSALARLRTDFQASGVRITQLTSMVASLEGQISSMGTPDAGPAGDSAVSPPSWSGELADGLLTGSWTFFRVDPRLLFDYSVSVPVELVRGEDRNGRTVVLARSPSARVGITFEELLVDPPPPVVEVRCSLSEKGKWFGIGGIFGAGVWEWVR